MSTSACTIPFSSEVAVTTYWLRNVLSVFLKVIVLLATSISFPPLSKLITTSLFVGTDTSAVMFSELNATEKFSSTSYQPSLSMSTLHW